MNLHITLKSEASRKSHTSNRNSSAVVAQNRVAVRKGVPNLIAGSKTLGPQGALLKARASRRGPEEESTMEDFTRKMIRNSLNNRERSMTSKQSMISTPILAVLEKQLDLRFLGSGILIRSLFFKT